MPYEPLCLDFMSKSCILCKSNEFKLLNDNGKQEEKKMIEVFEFL
jgi:thiol:disulfide interchange protein